MDTLKPIASTLPQMLRVPLPGSLKWARNVQSRQPSFFLGAMLHSNKGQLSLSYFESLFARTEFPEKEQPRSISTFLSLSGPLHLFRAMILGASMSLSGSHDSFPAHAGPFKLSGDNWCVSDPLVWSPEPLFMYANICLEIPGFSFPKQSYMYSSV